MPEDPAHDGGILRGMGVGYEDNGDGGLGQGVDGATGAGAGARAGGVVSGTGEGGENNARRRSSSSESTPHAVLGDEVDDEGEIVAEGTAREQGTRKGRVRSRNDSEDFPAAEAATATERIESATRRLPGRGVDIPAELTPGVLAAEEEGLAYAAAADAGMELESGGRIAGHGRGGHGGGRGGAQSDNHGVRIRGIDSPNAVGLGLAQGFGGSILAPDMRLGELQSDLHARRHILSQLVHKGQWFGAQPSRRVWGDEALENKAAEMGASALTSAASRVKRRMRLRGLQQGAALRLRPNEPRAL